MCIGDVGVAGGKMNGGVEKLTFLMCGATTVVSWLSFVSAVDFFDAVFPGYKVQYVTAAVNMSTLFLCTIGNIFLSEHSSAKSRMRVSVALLAGALCIVPLMNELCIVGTGDTLLSSWQMHVLFGVLMLAEVCAAGSSAIFQSSTYGMAGEMQVDGDLTAQVEIGKGVAGIAVLGIRAGTKAAFPATKVGRAHSATAFFMVAVGLVLLSMALFEEMLRRRGDGRPGPEARDMEADGAAPSESSRLLPQESGGELVPGSPARQELRAVLRAVWRQAASALLCFFICLSCFPGLTSSLRSRTWHLGDWFALALITLYNCGDLVGKTLPSYVMVFSARSILRPAVAMVLFVPAFLACLLRPVHDLVPCVLVAALGLCTGYVSCSAMMLGPEQVEQHRKDRAGQVCCLFLISGLCGGSLLGMAFSEVALQPSRLAV